MRFVGVLSSQVRLYARTRSLSTIRAAAARAVISHALKDFSPSDSPQAARDDASFVDAEDIATWRDIVVRRHVCAKYLLVGRKQEY